jgi:hypothetical protein
MTSTNRKILYSCLAIGVVICLCLVVIALGAGGILILRPGSILPSQNPSEATGIPGGSSLPSSAAGTPVDSTQAAVPADIARQMDEIQNQVVKLRHIQPQSNVTRTLLSPEELRKHVQNDFLKDYDTNEARNDTIVLSTLGLLDKNTDIKKTYLDLLSEQVAGFYDNKTKAMYVVQGEKFTGNERHVYAHEYTHALQDQAYDFENGLKFNDATCQQDSERCAALQALIEGDATVTELKWITTYASTRDRFDIWLFYRSYKSPVFDAAPAFMKDDLGFPYEAGQNFVQTLVDQGGEKAVDEAFRNPPVSTEQIMHPERYPEDKPVPVSLPDLKPALGEGWTEIDHNVMGEWYTYLILAKGLNPKYELKDAQARQAAQGWGGDNYAVYKNVTTGAIVFVLSTIWDTQKDADEFASAFNTYGNDRFGKPVTNQAGVTSWQTEDGVHTFHQDGQRTDWIFAPAADQAEKIYGSIKGQ